MTRSSPNPVPDAPGLVEYRGLDAVAEARHYPSRLDIRTVEYNTRLERAEQYLNLGERFWRLTLVLVTRAKALALQGSRLAHASTRHLPGQPL